MDIEMLPVLLAALLALVFAGYLARFILRQDAGTERIKEIASAIQEGARAFLFDEYRALAIVTIVIFIIFAAALEPRPWVGIAYLAGTITSAVAGYLGMSIAVRANSRTATAATSSWAKALKIAFSGGAVMGFCVVGLGLLGLTVTAILTNDHHVWLGYAVGASIVALFLRVGGGIFTKSADVGADLIGKVEAGIPEDDPRNPATIADNVGDNVGDIAGMGSDLYESYVSAIAAAMVLAYTGALFTDIDKGIFFPLLLGAIGIVAAIAGTFFVRAPEAEGTFEEQTESAHATMNRGVYVANLLMVIGGGLLTWFYLGSGEMGVFYAMIAGLACGFLIGMATEYFTGEKNPVKGIARASEMGPATTVIQGFAVGLFSTVVPVILVAVATWIAHWQAGLFGIAIAAEGMLITLGMLLAIDCYGPIADNAAGMAEMGELGQEVRERAEALDAVGNTTAAIGKGFAISSAALAALAWLATYFKISNDELLAEGKAAAVWSLENPDVVIGLFIGGMLPFIFSALSMRAVSFGAYAVCKEVRRQFEQMPGLMEGTVRPNYTHCVDITTRKALKGMIVPGLLVVIVPLILGFGLGLEALAGCLAGALVSGFVLAILMANAGGAWDNAKKYIEAGHHGGKGSSAHKAAVIGDTVGDPFKDTAGPSLNILIKVVGKVAVIFVPIFVLVAT